MRIAGAALKAAVRGDTLRRVHVGFVALIYEPVATFGGPGRFDVCRTRCRPVSRSRSRRPSASRRPDRHLVATLRSCPGADGRRRPSCETRSTCRRTTCNVSRRATTLSPASRPPGAFHRSHDNSRQLENRYTVSMSCVYVHTTPHGSHETRDTPCVASCALSISNILSVHGVVHGRWSDPPHGPPFHAPVPPLGRTP